MSVPATATATATATDRTDPPTAPAEQPLLDARFAKLARDERLLPVKLTPFFRRKVAEEVAALGHTEGPLHRMVHPTRERLTLRAPGEVRDWVDDRDNMPPASASGAIVHKYADRVLFMPTSTCAAHCQYCFRQDVLAGWEARGMSAVQAAVAELLAHLEAHPAAREVILSGGDPMTLPTRALRCILEPLVAHPRVTAIRVHTKTAAFAPAVFDDPAKRALLAEAGVRLVFHFAHPYEVCETVRATIATLRADGIRCYNQFPLLRHVNDHAELLAEHLTLLDELQVRNLSVFLPEPIVGSAPFRLSFARVERIADTLYRTTPSWINATRFVLDTPVGKVRREDIVARDPAAGTITFQRGERRIDYPDFPAALDRPGDLSTMLWRRRSGSGDARGAPGVA